MRHNLYRHRGLGSYSIAREFARCPYFVGIAERWRPLAGELWKFPRPIANVEMTSHVIRILSPMDVQAISIDGQQIGQVRIASLKSLREQLEILRSRIDDIIQYIRNTGGLDNSQVAAYAFSDTGLGFKV